MSSCSSQASTLVDEAPPAISLNGLKVALGGQPILQDLTLQVPRGQKVAIIGSSGAGKTTLFRALAGVLSPAAGELSVLGAEPARLSGRALRRWRRRIGVLYQGDNLIPQLRVVHNILMARLGDWSVLRALWSLLWPQQLQQARAVLRAVELEDRLWSMPGELSGGQQQRVAIARLMLQQPELMLADEPVSQLDIRLGQDVIQRLTELATGSDVTLLVNLHSLALLDARFDRVLALRDGQVFWDGPPANLTADLLRRLYGAEYQGVAGGY